MVFSDAQFFRAQTVLNVEATAGGRASERHSPKFFFQISNRKASELSRCFKLVPEEH